MVSTLAFAHLANKPVLVHWRTDPTNAGGNLTGVLHIEGDRLVIRKNGEEHAAFRPGGFDYVQGFSGLTGERGDYVHMIGPGNTFLNIEVTE